MTILPRLLIRKCPAADRDPVPQRFERPTFSVSDRVLAKTVVRPFQRFMHREASGGIVLIVATIVALIWANSPWSASYRELWHAHTSMQVGSLHIDLTMHEVVNDMFMALFFFVVGLEIKREMVVGELRTFKAAGLPAVGALGGMVVPALFFLAFNTSGAGSTGWGIPMATDIAFAVGVVALLGPRVSPRLKLFLLTLAIVDDIGAVLVIAIFYSNGLSFTWLALAGAGIVLVNVMKKAQVWDLTPYLVIGIFVWYATFESGVHATIAGVVLGLSTPAKPLLSRANSSVSLALDENADATTVRAAAWHVSETASVAERLQTLLHPYTSFVIIPLFALANAGLVLNSQVVSDAVGSGVTWGVMAGLVLGKPIGITLAVWLAVKLLKWELPRGIQWPEFIGMAMAAGIGFTVSLFVAELAWSGEGTQGLIDQAKFGVLVASFVAALVGALILWLFADASDEDPLPTEAPILSRPEQHSDRADEVGHGQHEPESGTHVEVSQGSSL
jgi:NhaA family Na+:H+ antiporter